MMNKSDSNLKTKISRSLTDLQNSLDEACRLGLPPNLVDNLNDTEESYFCEPLEYNFRNDLTYKSASTNLERLIANHEQQFTYSKYSKESVDGHQINNNKNNNNNINDIASRRKAYIDTLRLLAANKSILIKSQSCDALNVPGQFSSTNRVKKEVENVDRMNNNKKAAFENEIVVLKRKLIAMDEEMLQMKNELMYRDQPASMRSGDLRSLICSEIDQEPFDEMKRHLEVYKHRESELVNQLTEAISTIEEAKMEEMQAVMRAEQLKEDLENLKIRFQELVDMNQKKIQSQNAMEEQFVQETIIRMKNEISSATEQLRTEAASVTMLEDQLRTFKRENENLHAQIKALEHERCEQTEHLNSSIIKALLQRDEAVNQVGKLQNIIDRDRKNHSQEKSIMQEETNELRTRLSASENHHLNLTRDKMNLLNEQSQMKTEMTKLIQLNNAERNRNSNELKSVSQKQEERIKALQNELARKDHFYESMMNDAELVMRQQISLINKLKVELGSNVQDMDGFLDRHRDEIGSIQARFEQCTDELHVSKAQNRELQQALDNYGSTLEMMRDTCRNLEEKKSIQDKEIIDHLSRQNNLMRTVELLTMQLQNLRRRIPDCTCGAFDSMDSIYETKLFDGLINLAS